MWRRQALIISTSPPLSFNLFLTPDILVVQGKNLDERGSGGGRGGPTGEASKLILGECRILFMPWCEHPTLKVPDTQPQDLPGVLGHLWVIRGDIHIQTR